MSLISQTTSYTTPGTYTYTIPQGVGSLEFHLWGAGGADGGNGPSESVQHGTTTSQVQAGTTQVPGVPVTVQTGTTQVQSGTTQVQTGTTQVQSGSHQEAYTVSVASTDNKGFGSGTFNILNQNNNFNQKGTTSYRTVTQYRTVIDYITVPVYSTVPVYIEQAVYGEQATYVSQPVFTTVYTPVYNLEAGGKGGRGAAGGYASRKIQVTQGDVIVISVGNSGGGGGAGSASKGARGGAGGSATVVTVNGVIVGVAAGGGGGGGAGTSNQDGNNGTPATISGIGNGTQSNGSSSVTGPATGGGGGGGYYGGLAGTSGNSGGGGQGGVCYGTIIQGGTGTTPGGITIPQYPGHSTGYAANNGAAILVFNKSFNINVKRLSKWNPVNSAWVKVNGNWKEISNGWTKVSGVWTPLISADAVTGAENLLTPAITYSLVPDSTSISENDTVIFTLSTTGISAGTSIPYTVSGIDADDVATNQHLTGQFVVGTTDTITFTPRLDHTTKGTRILKVSLDNTTESATCTILDTSTTPIYTLSANVASINEGGAVKFTLSSANGITGESINYAISGIASSRITSGALTGTFVFGSIETADFVIANDYTTTGPAAMKMTLIGKGATTTVSVNDTSLTPSGSLTGTISGVTWTVPAGVYSAVVSALGGGGGGGGCDSHAGYTGFSGDKITGTISVIPGQVYTLYSGTGGGAGVSDQGSAPGGIGGHGYASGVTVVLRALLRTAVVVAVVVRRPYYYLLVLLY